MNNTMRDYVLNPICTRCSSRLTEILPPWFQKGYILYTTDNYSPTDFSLNDSPAGARLHFVWDEEE